jgi:hypothetical protein
MTGSSNPLHSRRGDIIRAIDTLIEAHDKWCDDLTATGIEDGSDLDAALQVAISTICYGDVPADCREIADRMRRVDLEYQAYVDRAKITTDGEPVQAFWSAFRDVIETYRKVRIAVEGRVLKSVKEYKAEGLNDFQIAVQFGLRVDGNWTGIFFTEHGQPLSKLIEQEADKPGSVIPADFVHPEDKIIREKLNIELQGHLDRATQVEQQSKAGIVQQSEAERLKEIEADVVEFLREGALPWQVAKRFEITLNQVDDVAKRHGIATESAPADSESTDEDSPVEPVDENASQEPPKATPDAVKAAAVERFESGRTDMKAIAVELSQHFSSAVTVQRVSALHSAWKRRTTAEATA